MVNDLSPFSAAMEAFADQPGDCPQSRISFYVLLLSKMKAAALDWPLREGPPDLSRGQWPEQIGSFDHPAHFDRRTDAQMVQRQRRFDRSYPPGQA